MVDEKECGSDGLMEIDLDCATVLDPLLMLYHSLPPVYRKIIPENTNSPAFTSNHHRDYPSGDEEENNYHHEHNNQEEEEEEVLSLHANYHTFFTNGQKFSLNCNYEFIKDIGTGAYGAVISAKDKRTNSKVAIKVYTMYIHLY